MARLAWTCERYELRPIFSTNPWAFRIYSPTSNMWEFPYLVLFIHNALLQTE
eukprot:jgi/Psemu1/302892/fgenesh1_kg.84_\